jgi:hypothetical protein
MTDATKLIAGLLLITVPTIEFGGTFLLSILSGKHPELTEFFGAAIGKGATRPGGLIALLWMGVVLLAASVITLGIGLIRSRG